jgi:hypothetical protein
MTTVSQPRSIGVGEAMQQIILFADRRFNWYFGLSLRASSDCNCELLARQMDEWGPAECRRRAREIVDQVLANAEHVPLATAVKRWGIYSLLHAAIAAAERRTEAVV